MIYYIWRVIKDGIGEFLFFFRKLFCKHYFVNGLGVGLCELRHKDDAYCAYYYACEKCYCPKRKTNSEKGGDE